MIGNVLPLNVEVNARGVAHLRSEFSQVETALGRVGRSAGGLHAFMGRIGTGLGKVGGYVTGAFGNVARGMSGIPAMLGMGLGVAGIVKLVKETADYESALVSMKLALRLTDDEAASLDEDMKRLAKETGQSRTELLAMARAATDVGVPLEKAVAGLRDAGLLAKILGVAPELVSPAMGGLEKLTGGKLSSRQQAGLLYEAQDKSGMREGMLLDLIAKLGPQLAGVAGGGRDTTGFLMANIAAVGEAFAGQPKKMRTAIDGLVGLITDPKNKEAFRKLGIDTNDLAGAEGKLLAGFAAGDKETIKLVGGLSDFFTTLMNTEGGMGRFNDVFSATTGDLTAMADRVTGAMDDMAQTSGITWGKMIEEFKGPLMDATKGALTWFAENGESLGKSLATFASVVVDVTNAVTYFYKAQVWFGKKIGELILGSQDYRDAVAIEGETPIGASFSDRLEYDVRVKKRMEEIRKSRERYDELNPGSSSMTPWFEGDTAAALSSGQVAAGGEVMRGGAGAVADWLTTAFMGRDKPIEINIVTSPDGAFTSALDSATGRTKPTTTTSDGQTHHAMVGG